MKIKLSTNLTVEDTILKLKNYLEKNSFIFEEKDREYFVKKENKKLIKIVTKSYFWSRKASIKDCPSNFSLTIEGYIFNGNENQTIIDSELKEYHGKREHKLAGGMIIEKYANLLCNFINELD
jgi:hypothetical protein